jgi:hypothetical protein
MKTLTRALLSLALISLLASPLLADPLGLAVVGRYAYVGGSDGLTVVDVSNPEAPKQVGCCKLPGPASDIALSGGIAYIATRQSGLWVVDITDPKAPTEVGSYQPRLSVRPTAKKGEHWGPVVECVAVAGKLAYVTLNSVPKGKDAWRSVLQVLDVSNPKAPVELGSFTKGDLFLGVALAGKYAFVADKASTLWVVDVSDPKMPTEAGSCVTTGEPQRVFVARNHAYVADDDGAMHIADISDPRAPKKLGSFEEATKDSPAVGEAVAVAGRYAYIASDHNALYVVDISDAKAPKEVALLKLKGPALGVVVAGDYVYVNVFRGDLFIMKLKEKQGR